MKNKKNFYFRIVKKKIIKDIDYNKLFTIKDNFWYKNTITSASSLFLSNFISPFNSSVINYLIEKKFVLLGKSFSDEFGCGGTGLFSCYGEMFNPHNKNMLVGGSSSGSAISVSKKKVTFSIAHDTGDSIRRPSAYCKVFGFKPSYGLISRFGLIPMASSLDTVGIISSDPRKILKIFKIISKFDSNDLITFQAHKKIKFKRNNLFLFNKKVCLIKGIEDFLSKEFLILYNFFLGKLKEKGYVICYKELPYVIKKYLYFSYIVISSSEVFSHLNSLQGVTFAKNNEFKYNETSSMRGNYFGEEVKKRILAGSHFLNNQNLLNRVKKICNLVIEWINNVFLENEFLIFPSITNNPQEISDFKNKKNTDNFDNWSDNLFLLANFSGIPSLTFPFKKDENDFNSFFSITVNSFFKNDKEIIKFSKEFSFFN